MPPTCTRGVLHLLRRELGRALIGEEPGLQLFRRPVVLGAGHDDRRGRLARRPMSTSGGGGVAFRIERKVLEHELHTLRLVLPRIGVYAS